MEDDNGLVSFMDSLIDRIVGLTKRPENILQSNEQFLQLIALISDTNGITMPQWLAWQPQQEKPLVSLHFNKSRR
jgi:hypothetical protein